MKESLTSVQQSPSNERKALPVAVRVVGFLVVPLALGVIERLTKTAPPWVAYPPQLLLTLLVGLVLGWMQEQPTIVSGVWRALRWRMAWYESISWSVTLILFLKGIRCWDREGGWQTYLVVAFCLLGILHLSSNLITRFRCPCCRQLFFPAKATPKQRDSTTFFSFPFRQYLCTHCQYCEWPLWEPVDDHSPARTSVKATP